MEPRRIGIPSDKLFHIHAFHLRRTPHALLLAVDEDHHELLPAFLPRSPFRGTEFALSLAHTMALAVTPNVRAHSRRVNDAAYANRTRPQRRVRRDSWAPHSWRFLFG